MIDLASFGLEVRVGRHGRAVYNAGYPRPAGDLLLRVPAHSWCLQWDRRSERCAGCLRKGDKLPECSRCRGARFCNTGCQKSSWPRHKAECAMIKALGSNLEKLPSLIVDEMLLLLHTLSRHEGIEDVLGMALPSGPRADNRGPARLCAPFLKSVVSMREEDVELELARAQANNFLVVDDVLSPVASGCYPELALLNHSCEPNCVLSYVEVDSPSGIDPSSSGPMASVRALRPIAPGEELTHSYVDLLRDVTERRAHLEATYGFSCECPRCSREAARQSPATPAHPSELQDLSRASALHAQGNDLESEDWARQAALLEDALSIRSRLLPATHIDVASSTSALLRVFLEAGRMDKALPVCASLCKLYEGALPPNHPLIGLQLHLLADLHDTQSEPEKAEQVRGEAKKVMAIVFGPEHPLAKG